MPQEAHLSAVFISPLNTPYFPQAGHFPKKAAFQFGLILLVIVAMFKQITNYCKNSLLEDADRWVLWIPVFFGLGVGVYFILPTEPSLYAAGGLVSGACGLFILSRRKQFAIKALSVIFLIFALGFLAAKIRTETSGTAVVEYSNKPITLSGNIEDINYSGSYPSITLRNLRIDEFTPEQIPKYIRLNVRTKIKGDIKTGDRIITDAILLPPARPVIAGGYDFSKAAYYDQVGANGYAIKTVVRLKTGHEPSFVDNLRTIISDKIMGDIEGEKGAIANALITGERSFITQKTNDEFRRSGLAHLLAVSGMNLAMAGGIIFFSVRFLLSLFGGFAERYPIKKIAAIMAILGNVFYLMVSGMTPSAERAFIMVSLVMIGIVFDRSASPMRSIAFSALIILAVTPETLFMPGFQMSFAAALALISSYELLAKKSKLFRENDDEPERERWFRKSWNKIWLYPATLMLTSFIAGMATAPFAAYHFNQFVNYGLLANLLAIPLTSVIIMPATVLGMVLMPLGLEKPVFYLMGFGVDWIMQIAEWVASFKGAAVVVPHIPPYGLLLISAGGLWLFLWQKNWRYFGLMLALAGVLAPYFVTKPDLIINETGSLFAINRSGKLYLSNKRSSFASKSWLNYFGQSETLRLPYEEVYQIKGVTFSADCGKADIVLDKKGDGCFGDKLTLTKKELLENGSYSFYIEDNNYKIQTVKAVQGDRGWVK